MMIFNTDVDIYIEDIIDNLEQFSKSDLSVLKEELDSILEENKKEKTIFNVKTLEDEYKIKILKEMYNKFTLEELDKLNKK